MTGEPKPLAVGDRVRLVHDTPGFGLGAGCVGTVRDADEWTVKVEFTRPRSVLLRLTEVERIDPAPQGDPSPALTDAMLDQRKLLLANEERMEAMLAEVTAERDAAREALAEAQPLADEMRRLQGAITEMIGAEPKPGLILPLPGQPRLTTLTAERDAAIAKVTAERDVARAELAEERAKRERLVAALREYVSNPDWQDDALSPHALEELIAESEAKP